jgi:hypothetical protein
MKYVLAFRVATEKEWAAVASMDGNWAHRPQSRIILKLQVTSLLDISGSAII